jgi:hypothetical protein
LPNFKTLGRTIAHEMVEACEGIAAKHGVTITYGGMTYGDDNATLKMKVAKVSETGLVLSKHATDFIQIARSIGMSPDDLGKVVVLRGTAFKIEGARPRAQRLLLGSKVEGRSSSLFILDHEEVKAALCDQKSGKPSTTPVAKPGGKCWFSELLIGEFFHLLNGKGDAFVFEGEKTGEFTYLPADGELRKLGHCRVQHDAPECMGVRRSSRSRSVIKRDDDEILKDIRYVKELREGAEPRDRKGFDVRMARLVQELGRQPGVVEMMDVDEDDD